MDGLASPPPDGSSRANNFPRLEMALASRASVALTIVPPFFEISLLKNTFPRHDSINEVKRCKICISRAKYYLKFNITFFIGQGNYFLTRNRKIMLELEIERYYIVTRPHDCWLLLEKRTSHRKKVSYGHAYS